VEDVIDWRTNPQQQQQWPLPDTTATPAEPPVPDIAQLKPGQLQAIIVAAIAAANEESRKKQKRLGIGGQGVVAIIAALAFGLAGLQLISIQSLAGDTIAEAFYNGVGIMCFGLAALSIVIGTRDR
jgi:hypothetical protein